MSDTKNNTGEENTGYRNSGYWNSGDWNSGYGNSTSRSSGIFNNQESEVVMFNKPSGKKWNEIDHPHFNEFYTCRWIGESDMTDEEKKNDPNFFVRGGYLKTFEYKEAWANFWRDTDEANRKKFLVLPNFDAEVFLDITGIDVRVAPKDEEVRKAIELLTAKGKLKDGKILN